MGPPTKQSKAMKVQDLICPITKGWDREKIVRLLPNYEKEILVLRPSKRGATDRHIWLLTKTGDYSAKSGYQAATQMGEKPGPQNTNQSTFNWMKEVWNIKCSTKLKYLLWKAMKDILPVGENLRSRGVENSALCPHCSQPETTLHLFFHCPLAREVWNLAPFKAIINPDLINNIRMGVEASKSWTTLPPTGIGKAPLLPWILWAIWTNRNKRIFERRQLTAPDILSQAISQAREWLAAQTIKPLTHEACSHRQLPPPPGLHPETMNCFSDAAWKKDSGSAGFGWIFIDPITKSEIHGRSTASNVSSALLAEAMALHKAQQHAIDLGFKNVLFASDSQMLIKALNSEPSSKELHGIQHDILNLSLSFDEIVFSFVSRNFNRRADESAKSSLLSVLMNLSTEPIPV